MREYLKGVCRGGGDEREREETETVFSPGIINTATPMLLLLIYLNLMLKGIDQCGREPTH